MAEQYILLTGSRSVRLGEACHSRVVNQVLKLEPTEPTNKLSEKSIIIINNDFAPYAEKQFDLKGQKQS